jgi:hypothetical protein
MQIVNYMEIFGNMETCGKDCSPLPWPVIPCRDIDAERKTLATKRVAGYFVKLFAISTMEMIQRVDPQFRVVFRTDSECIIFFSISNKINQ